MSRKAYKNIQKPFTQLVFFSDDIYRKPKSTTTNSNMTKIRIFGTIYQVLFNDLQVYRIIQLSFQNLIPFYHQRSQNRIKSSFICSPVFDQFLTFMCSFYHCSRLTKIVFISHNIFSDSIHIIYSTIIQIIQWIFLRENAWPSNHISQ